MRRFLLFLSAGVVVAAMAGAVHAEMVYYVEDFENNGVPGFDPLFNHTFSAEPPRAPYWQIGEWPPGIHSLLLVYGTTDAITFNLPTRETVVYASVSIDHGINAETSVRFIGSQGSWKTGPDDYRRELVEISSLAIGPIQSIELWSTQGIFYDVTIGVVPEPSGWALMAFLASATAIVPLYVRVRPS